MINKIKLEESEKIAKECKIKSYFINPYWLAFRGFWEEKNGEILFYERDVSYENDFPFISMPKKEINLLNAIITNATFKELENIKSKKIKIRNSFVWGEEFYYKTADLIKLDGPKFSSFRKAVNKFKKNYHYSIKNEYPKELILEFLEKWEKTQKDKNELFEINKKYERFCIENCGKINGKWLFVEVEGELAGYSLSYKLDNDFWIGIHQKVNYNYSGIGRFLLHERAKLFQGVDTFSLGTAAKDEGIDNFKESLHPINKISRYYIITEGK